MVSLVHFLSFPLKMALDDKEIKKLEDFVSLLKAFPAMLHQPNLAFFRDYLESLGATIPPPPAMDTDDEPAPQQAKKEAEPEAKKVEPEPAEPEVEEDPESDLELDMEGVIGEK